MNSVWSWIFGMEFLFLSLIILQRLLFGFHQGQTSLESLPEAFIAVGVHLTLSCPWQLG